jgi:hypothetical protein
VFELAICSSRIPSLNLRILLNSTENPKNPFGRNSHLIISGFCKPYWRADSCSTLARPWTNLLEDEMKDCSRKGREKNEP